MKVLDFGQCTYAFFVYIQMVFFYFWIHMFSRNPVEQIEDRTERIGKKGYYKNSRKIANLRIADGTRLGNGRIFLMERIKLRYFEWGIYFIYLLVSYYFVDSIEKYIGVQIVFLLSIFCWKREKFFTKKMCFILFYFCVPELIVRYFKIEGADTIQRYGIYKNLQQLFLTRVLQIILFVVVVVGNRDRWIKSDFGKADKIDKVEEKRKALERIVFFVFPFLSKLKERREVAEKQNLFYQNQFNKVQSSLKHIDILWHDLKHHLFILDRLIKNKAWEDATQYIEKLIGREERIEDLENTGNLVIDSIVNYKRKMALENGISFEARIEIPDGFVFDAFDITVLLGNLLDNALYAAKGTESAFLFIFIKYSKKRLMIVVRNSVCGKEKRILRKSQYGIGLQSVRKTVFKYHGDLETSYNYGEFYAKVILFLENVVEK